MGFFYFLLLVVIIFVAVTVLKKYGKGKLPANDPSVEGFPSQGVQLSVDTEALAKMGKRGFKKGMVIVGAVIVLVILSSFVTTVPASHYGVVTLWGHVTDTVLPEGLHFVNPFAKVHKVSVRLDTAKTDHSEAASKDLQTVHTSVTVNYHVNPKEVRNLYVQNPNLRYEYQYVIPAIKEILKSVTSNYTAEELVTKRSEVSVKIRDQLALKLARYHLVVQDINITDFQFSKAFNESIENKVRATQEAERAQRDLQRVKFEAEQKIVTARAMAQAIKIQTQAINAHGGAAYVQLEAIKKWDGKLPTYMGGNAPVPFIGVQKSITQRK